MKKSESKSSEVICSEFTISNEKWICFSVYRSPTQNNLECFFNDSQHHCPKPAKCMIILL